MRKDLNRSPQVPKSTSWLRTYKIYTFDGGRSTDQLPSTTHPIGSLHLGHGNAEMLEGYKEHVHVT